MAGRKWKTREEYRKEKELEEARKAGTAAPQQDEDGRDINPHIPQYIAQAPWYVDTVGVPGLKHQRVDAFGKTKQFDSIDKWYSRGKFDGPAATKFRPGSCTNCGAISHTAKFCTERPRKIGAKYNQKDIKPDEVVMDVHLDYDGKRDRWNGWDPNYYKKVMEQFEKTDVERRKKKAEEQAKKFMTEPDPGHQRYPHVPLTSTTQQTENNIKLADDSEEEDDFRDKEENNSERFMKKDPKTRTTIRNLRIREDTAKYLRNLDPDSAFYDPKSRSMRENPNPDKNPEEVGFAGDNFIRDTGEAQQFDQIRRYAWESFARGKDIHLQAAPSQVEIMFQKDQKEQEVKRLQIKNEILEQYGGQEYLNTLPKELLIAQTEHYIEYSSDGKIIKGQDKAIPKSKFQEDVCINNHTSVWGSYWVDGKWGYACCKTTIKNSYCTGELKQLDNPGTKNSYVVDPKAPPSIPQLTPTVPKPSSSDAEEASDNPPDPKNKDKKSKKERKTKKSKKGKKRKRESKEEANTDDDRKRKYNSLQADIIEVTEEEMENYKQKRLKFDDPMKGFIKA